MNHALDGEWEAENVSCLNTWLHRLLIIGPQVLDGEGSLVQLRRATNGDVTLEGGTLTLEGEMLVRTGKSGRRTLYVSTLHDGEASEDDDSLPSRNTTRTLMDLPWVNSAQEFSDELLDVMPSLPGSAGG